MTSHTFPPYLGHFNVLSTQLSSFPTFLELEQPILSPHFSHLLSFHQGSNSTFLSNFLYQIRDSRLIIKLSHTLGKYNSSSPWLLHFPHSQINDSLHKHHHILVRSSNLQVIIQVFLSWTLLFFNTHLLKLLKVSSYPYIFMFSQVFRGGIQVKTPRT